MNNIQEKSAELFSAIENGDVEQAQKLLIGDSWLISYANPEGKVPLVFAILQLREACCPMVDMLLDFDPEIDFVENDDSNVLSYLLDVCDNNNSNIMAEGGAFSVLAHMVNSHILADSLVDAFVQRNMTACEILICEGVLTTGVLEYAEPDSSERDHPELYKLIKLADEEISGTSLVSSAEDRPGSFDSLFLAGQAFLGSLHMQRSFSSIGLWFSLWARKMKHFIIMNNRDSLKELPYLPNEICRMIAEYLPITEGVYFGKLTKVKYVTEIAAPLADRVFFKVTSCANVKGYVDSGDKIEEVETPSFR